MIDKEKFQELFDFIWSNEMACEYNCNEKISNKIKELFELEDKDQ